MKIPEILIVETVHQPGSLASVLQVIADAGLAIEHLSALRRDQGRTLWEITVELDEQTDRSLYERIDQLPNARFIGKSDRVGGYPVTTPYSPDDIGATVYHVLGLDPAAEARDRQERPVQLNRGQVIRPLFTATTG